MVLSLLLGGSSFFPQQQELVQAFLVPTHKTAPVTVRHHSPSSSTTNTATRPAALQSAASGVPITAVAADDNVPEGHKGLHEFLYGDNNDHGATSAAAAAAAAEAEAFTRTQTPLPVAAFLDRFKDARLAAVYGVYDAQQTLRYVGVTRNVVVSLTGHLQAHGAEVVSSVALQSFKFPKREEMAAAQETWLAELSAAGIVPDGNREGGGGIGGWAKSIKEAVEQGSGSTAEERAAYEDTKTKLRTAMADPTLADELDDLDEEEEYGEEAEEDRVFRRAQLKKAVEQSDWSGVIDGQTQATIKKQAPQEVAAPAAPAPTAAVVSPFNGGGSSSSSVSDGPLSLTPENVDLVLEEVRPYLISDGGNIEIVSIDVAARDIFLRLQGACGSCPSSTTTMKMGVERVLREKFSNLNRIEAISAEPQAVDEAGTPLTEAAALKRKLEGKLEEILPAIRGLGASATIEDVSEGGVVSLCYRGPEKVKLGVVYALKGQPGVTDVKSV